MSGKTRIKDIAFRLGVSPATVSRALGDTDIVAEPTRTRVREMARALDYRPDVNARSLRTRKSMAVLLVVRDIGNPFYLEIVKGVEAKARAAGYAVLMGNTENDAGRENEYFNMLRDGHADGMILITGKLPKQRGRTVPLPDDLPVVIALEVIEGAAVPHVQIDNRGAAAEAVRHLIDLGHRRIAHISGPVPEILSRYRLEGYRQAMAAADLPIPPGYEQRGTFLLHSGEEACEALFDLPDPPTALFVANDEMAFGAINQLRKRRVRVPNDVSVVGFDDLYLGEAFFPPLTTVNQPRTEIGAKAMDILLDLLTGEAGPAEPVILPTRLVVRGSTAPPPKKKRTKES